jgi:hypothetical protein
VVLRHPYSDPARLRLDIEQREASIVYLSAGLGPEVPAIAAALDGTTVLTVSSVGRDVERGAVLGFDIVSSRPQIAVNLARARAQHLELDSQFLRLVRVIR